LIEKSLALTSRLGLRDTRRLPGGTQLLQEVLKMPMFRPLQTEELAALQARRGRSIDLAEYSDFVRDLQIGEGGEVTLGADEQKRTVKRRLSHAAHLFDKDLRYRRTEGNVIRFEILGSAAR
jgi:hypothetical protein